MSAELAVIPQQVDTMLSRAIEKGLDADSLAKLVELQERVMAKQAEQEFAVSMRAAQGEIKPISRDRMNSQTSSKYATLEALNRIVVPVYTRYGFSLSFGTEDSSLEGYIRVVCDVLHIGGHSRRYHFDLPLDDVGIAGKTNKTRVHASGSTLSYGRRYLTMLIFNVAITDDDDGNGAGTEYVTEEQAATIKALADEVKADLPKFLQYVKAGSIAEIPAAHYSRAVKALEAKRRQA